MEAIGLARRWQMGAGVRGWQPAACEGRTAEDLALPPWQAADSAGLDQAGPDWAREALAGPGDPRLDSAIAPLSRDRVLPGALAAAAGLVRLAAGAESAQREAAADSAAAAAAESAQPEADADSAAAAAAEPAQPEAAVDSVAAAVGAAVAAAGAAAVADEALNHCRQDARGSLLRTVPALTF